MGRWHSPCRGVTVAIARGQDMAMQQPRGLVWLSIPVNDWQRPCEPLAARKVSMAAQTWSSKLIKLLVKLPVDGAGDPIACTSATPLGGALIRERCSFRAEITRKRFWLTAGRALPWQSPRRIRRW